MKWFTIDELTRSAKASLLGIDNTPTPEAEIALTQLVDNVLDPLREAFGKPILVTSGYRCPKLNAAVGGASTSQHLKGEAADIIASIGGRSLNKRLFKLIQELGLPFDQLIDEKNYAWIHVSYSARHRRQILHL